MSKNLALTLARAKNNGIREGIDAVCEAMPLAHEQGGPCCLRSLLSGCVRGTFKEYKKLWGLPADIKARESRI